MLAPWHVVAGEANHLRDAGAIVVDRSEYAKLKIDRVGHQTEISCVHSMSA